MRIAFVLALAVWALIAIMAGAALIHAAELKPWERDRGWTHPHDYIRQAGRDDGIDCCGGADCVPLSNEVALSLRLGQTVTLPAVGHHPEQYVRVKHLYPAPPPTAEFDFALGWGCHTGCFFQWGGI